MESVQKQEKGKNPLNMESAWKHEKQQHPLKKKSVGESAVSTLSVLKGFVVFPVSRHFLDQC